ncbi:response regulator transcription factor [Halarcobacter ebronensis]|uniref:Transcriptional regulator n=1 Tax=Halarcobacter ebronensis TaxID=1462615 RepID=A0A4V1LZG1_9BACT|nr:response regulator transcription factor [Halarcobacter ebronensis]QKF83038.1 two-component system response regulator [Halarcobacter ebronensis]RXK00865.1 transcriptional regulator [Halarcobacter ebronensis]
MDYAVLKKYTKNLNILFVEDDTDFRKEFSELLLDIFPNVTTAVDGLDAFNKYKEFYLNKNKYYDLIISDIKMPNYDGVQLVDSVYKINKDQLVIILSARNEFEYLLPLVNLGIHQFFTKPIDYNYFLEDIYKLCNQIYHTNLNKNSDLIRINETLFWDKNKRKLLREEKSIELTKNEIRFVATILNNNGTICTVDKLIDIIWEEDFDLNPDITHLKSLIYRLRKKVPDLYIKNIYGMGYIHEAE